MNVYGVTASTLREEFFPTVTPFGSTTRPTATVVATRIERIAASLAAVLSAHGVDPDTLDSVGEPIAYAWLGATLGYGAAADVGRIAGGGADSDAIKAWSAEFERRLAALRADPRTWIPDAFSASAAWTIASHVTDLGLEDDTSEIETDNGPLFTVNDER